MVVTAIERNSVCVCVCDKQKYVFSKVTLISKINSFKIFKKLQSFHKGIKKNQLE